MFQSYKQEDDTDWPTTSVCCYRHIQRVQTEIWWK